MNHLKNFNENFGKNEVPYEVKQILNKAKKQFLTQEDIDRLYYLYKIGEEKTFHKWMGLGKENPNAFKELNPKKPI